MRTRRLRYGHEYNVVDIDPYGCTREAVPSERQKRVLVGCSLRIDTSTYRVLRRRACSQNRKEEPQK